MNTYATMIAGTVNPARAGSAARADARRGRHAPDPVSSGIRGSGQYCRLTVPRGTEPTMTALRMTRGMMAAGIMCP